MKFGLYFCGGTRKKKADTAFQVLDDAGESHEPFITADDETFSVKKKEQ